MKKIYKILIIAIIGVVLLGSLAGCQDSAENNQTVKPAPMEINLSRPYSEVLSTSKYMDAINDFSIDLFETLDNTQNTCISPLSVYIAFAILSNGAANETLNQIADVMHLTPTEINEYSAYLYSLYQDDETNAQTVQIANSVWFKESFTPKQDFIDNAAAYYDAEIIKALFNNDTVKQTNAWVKEKTRGMIDKVVESYSPYTIMQIINALVFEDNWTKALNDGEHMFTYKDGSIRFVEGGYKKQASFFESNNAEAFKYYFKNNRFCFLGIKPKVELGEYLDVFDKDELYTLLNNENTSYDIVKTFVPYFDFDYSVNLKQNLMDLGMVDAFSEIDADFSRAWDAEDNVFVSYVNHKTHFELSRDGVKAAAVTSIGMEVTSTPPSIEPKIKELYLDKPFIYMILDKEYNVPLFIGTINTIE